MGNVRVRCALAASLALLAFSGAAPVRADSPEGPLTALMMGGTGQPTPSSQWMNAIVSDYLSPATGNSYNPVAVTTPEGLPVDSSVRAGLAALQAAMADQQARHPGQPYLIEGFSQSALIAIDEKRELAALAAAGQPIPDVTLALFGSGNRPNGGIYERFAGLYVPGIGVDATGAEPTDSGIPTIDIAGQYDGGADFPQYPVNLLADLNAALGFIYVHGDYGGLTESLFPGPTFTPLAEPFTDQYVEGSSEIVRQVSGDTTFYFIPTQALPLFGPLRTLGVPESVIDIVQPAARVIVEAGYDRSIPLGEPTPAQLIPTVDPVSFVLELDRAVLTGAGNALGLIGIQLPAIADLEQLLAAAASESAQAIGVPYYEMVSTLNADFNPITAFLQLERPIGQGIQEVLELTGIQQLLDPILGLIGTLGGLFTG